MKAVGAAFNQEKALVGAFSVITNLRMELFETLVFIVIVMIVMMVLMIRNVTLRDAGMYICELNTATVTRSFHELKVITDKMLVAPVSSSGEPVTSAPPSR